MKRMHVYCCVDGASSGTKEQKRVCARALIGRGKQYNVEECERGEKKSERKM